MLSSVSEKPDDYLGSARVFPSDYREHNYSFYMFAIVSDVSFTASHSFLFIIFISVKK